MSKAKKKGLFAFLLALLASAIVSGALLLSPATVNAAAGTETADDGTVTISNVRYGNELFSAVTRGGIAGQPLVIRFAENTGMNFTVGEGGNLYDSATGESLGADNFVIYDEYTAASSITLDLNGGSITLDTQSVKALDVRGVELTIMNGAIKGTASENLATSDSDITLENVDITFNYEPAATPSGGAAVVTTANLTLADVYFTLNGTGATEYTAEGTVTNAVAKVGDTYYTDVKTAIESATDGQTVTLTDNATLSGVTYVRAKNVTLDLGNRTLTIPENFQDKLYDDQGEEKGAGVAIRVYGSLTLVGGENGRIDAKGAADSINPFAAQPGGVITVNSGTIEVDTNSEACIYASQGGLVTINGGSLINRATGDYTWGGEEVLVVNAASNATTPANTMVQVNGGTFIGRNPAFGDDAIGGTFITKEVKTVTYTLDGQTYVMVYDTAEPALPEGAVAIGGDYFEGETLVNEVNSAAALSSVLGNVAEEAYIRLGASFKADVVIPEGKTVTLDLNGKTLTNVNDHTILNYGTLIITDTPGGGTVDNVTHTRAAVYNEYGGDVIILGGTFRRSAEASTSYTENGGNSYYVIANEGDMVIGSADEDCNIIVYTGDSYEDSMYTHMYSALVNTLTYDSSQESHLTIYDGEFYGGNIAIKGDTWSTLAIRGGTISAGSQAVQTWEETLIDGGEFNGRVVGWMDENGNRATLTIESGTFNGALETLLLGNDGNKYKTDEIETSVSGGEFANAIPESYIAENCLLFPNEDGTYSVGGETAAIAADMTAVIGKVAYESLYDAVANVKDGETITMIADDLNASGVIVPSGSNFTIDFNGHTFVVTQNLAGSTGTKSQVFQLLKDSTITMKNGTLRGGVSGVKMIIQNYADLTLEDMTLDAADSTSAACEALSVNNGDVVIKGNTQLLARDNAYAFDIYYWPANSYTDGATVTFDESFNGKVEGMVAYSSDGTDDENIHEKAVLVINGNGTFDITLEVKANIEENITANGGNFDFVLPEEYLGEGASLYTDGEGGYAVAPANEAPEGMNKVAVTVNGKGYSSIAAALEATEGEVEIKLYDDLVENVVIPAGKTVILDLAGKTISAEKDNTIENKGTLTINGEGSIDAEGMRTALRNRSGATLTVNGGTISSDNGTALNSAGTLIVNGGTFTTDGGGQAATLTGTTVINNGEFITNTPATSTASNAITAMVGELTIKGGTFEAGKQAVAASNGATVIIEDGDFSVRSYANGNILYADNAVLTVSGGTFKAPNSEEVETVNVTASGSAQISGGEFSTMPRATYFEDGFVASWNEERKAYVTVEGEFVASIGAYSYATLQEAINAAAEGATVKLLADVKENVDIGKALTLDLNGNDITSTGSRTYGVIIKAGDVTVTDGTAAGEPSAVIGVADRNADRALAITNGAKNVRIENVKIDGHVAVWVEKSSEAVFANVDVDANLAGIGVSGPYDEATIAGASEENYTKVTITGSNVHAYNSFAVFGNGSQHGTDITVTDSVLSVEGVPSSLADGKKAGTGIFNPQVGILTVSGNTTISAPTGIEMRSGTLNIADDTVTVESTSDEFFAIDNGNGTTMGAVAVAISQHATNQTINVNISGGNFIAREGGFALYEADTHDELSHEDIAIAITGGTFNGAVESKNVKGFITGGRFAELPAEDAFAEGLEGELYNGYYVVVNASEAGTAASIADRLSAQSDLRAYLAAFGLTLADMEAAESDEFAAAVTAAYEEIFLANTKDDIATALAAAMDAVDAYRANLAAEKAAAIEELNTYAAGTEELAAVAVPTYAVSAINGAVTVAEVNAYVDLAKAEMDDIRAERAKAEEQFAALNAQFEAVKQALGISGNAEEGYTSEVLDKLNGVIEALGITEADGAWSTDLLDGITQDLETANENIAAMQDLLGTAADEATAQTIIGMIKATQNSVAAAETNIKNAISTLSSDIQTKYDALMQAVGELPTNDAVEALTERLAALEGTVSRLDTTVGNLGTDIGKLETAVAGLTTAQDELTQAINGYKTAVDGILTDMSGKFAEISGKLDDLPTNDELAQALTNALSGVTEQLTLIKAEVDKIDGLDEAVIGGVSSAITEAFASFTQTFNTAMSGINTKLDSLTSAVAALPDDADITALKEAVQAATDAAKEAGTKVDTLGTTLSGRFDSVDTTLEGIDGTIAGLTTAQNALAQAINGYKTAVNSALAGIEQNIAGVKADIKNLADTAAADKLELLEKLNALQTSADAIEQAIASLDGDSSADLSAISAELAALQTSLGDVADVVDEVALGNTNSSSSFAGIYVYLSAILVLAAVILIVLAVKKRR